MKKPFRQQLTEWAARADKELREDVSRFRHSLALLLIAIFEKDPPAGAVVPDTSGRIDDGVIYELPLVIPEGVTADQRQAIVAKFAESSSVFHFPFDRPYKQSDLLSAVPIADPLKEWTFQTRKEVLARCHLAWERNPIANTAVGLTTLFSIGEGLQVTYRNKDVEELLENFRKNEENGIDEYEKAFCDALQVDGELFVRFFSQDGMTVIVPLPPWEIDWIKSERGFYKRVEQYHQIGTQTTGEPGDTQMVDEPIPADDILHVTINKLPYESRGRPELFRILPWLKAYKDWLEDRARQNKWRGSLLWWVKLIGGQPGQVAAKRSQYKQPPPPGSLVVTNDKEEWSAVDNKVGAADVAEDGRQMKLMNAVGAKLPEYMLSDGENANLASATAQQLPALKKFTDFQDINVGRVWKPIYRRVIENAIRDGVLPEEVDEQDEDGEPVREEGDAIDEMGNPVEGPIKRVKSIDAFDVKAPQLEESDPKNMAEAVQIAINLGLLSDEDASAELGYDYRIQQKKIRRQLANKVRRAMQGQALAQINPLDPSGPKLADFQTQDEEPQGAKDDKAK